MNSCLKFSHSLLFPCKQGNCSVQLVGHLCVGLGAVCSDSRGLVFLGAFSGLGGERMLKRGGGTCCFPLLSLEVGLTTLGQLPVQQRALLWHGHWPILAFLMSSHMFQNTTMFFPPPCPWETLWCSSTHFSSHKFSRNPLIKAPILALPPKAVSITLLWNPQSEIPKCFNSWNFPPTPMKLRVTCQCKYP